jgi:hypothetical protein
MRRSMTHGRVVSSPHVLLEWFTRRAWSQVCKIECWDAQSRIRKAGKKRGDAGCSEPGLLRGASCPNALNDRFPFRRHPAATEVAETRLQLRFGFSLESLAVGYPDFAMVHAD